jgi:hypothetical protein
MTTEADIQRDQQVNPDLSDAIMQTILSMLKNTHTALPGIVKGFNKTTMTASVLPALQRKWVDEGYKALPLCVDVPVFFRSGGDFIETCPVQENDECLLVFAERAIDHWLDHGGVQPPSEVRFHDLSDGFAFVGFFSKVRAAAVVGLEDDAYSIRTKDGATAVSVTKDKAYVGGRADSQAMIMGENYRNAEGEKNSALAAAIHTLNGVAQAMTPADILIITGLAATVGPFLTAFKVFAPLWLTAVQEFEAKSATFLAQQGMVR